MATQRRHLDVGWGLEMRFTLLGLHLLCYFGNVLAFVGLLFWDVNLIQHAFVNFET